MNNHFLAVGTYEQPNLGIGLRDYALGIAALNALPKKTQYRIKYEGHMVGKTVRCTMKREKVADPLPVSGLLRGANKGIDILMILSESLKEIRVYEKGEGKERKFYVIARNE